MKRRSYGTVILLFLAYGFVSSIVVEKAVVSRAWHNHSRVTLHDTIRGNAWRPFCYRALWPLVIRYSTDMTPQAVKNIIFEVWNSTDRYKELGTANGFMLDTAQENYWNRTQLNMLKHYYLWSPLSADPDAVFEATRKIQSERETEYVYSLALMWLSLVGFGFIIRSLLRSWEEHSELLCNFAPVLVIGFLPYFVSYFVYDYPNLFLFSLCYAIIATKRLPLAALLVLMPFAVASKETALLLPFLCFYMNYVSYYLPEINRRVKMYSGLLLLIGLVTFAIIRFAYSDNPGGLVEHHFFDNLRLLCRPATYFQFDAFGLPRGMNIILLFIVAWFVRRGLYAEANPFRDNLWPVPVLFCLALFFGIINEMRMYLELVPILAPYFIAGLNKTFSNHTTELHIS